jgi:hypothetical protein
MRGRGTRLAAPGLDHLRRWGSYAHRVPGRENSERAARRVAVLYWGGPGDGPSPRLEPVLEALDQVGLVVRAVPYDDSRAAEIARVLSRLDGVLVWADPLTDYADRLGLDQMLREVASAGVWVSAHPDVIDRIGTKEVLVITRDLPWGTDTYLYRTPEEFREQFPARLAADRVRVLKASRGNGGRTVWKVSLPSRPEPAARIPTPVSGDAMVHVQHARVRDGSVTVTTLAEVMSSCEAAFASREGTGQLIDQEFLPGVARGIIRCYLVATRVIGFARQYPAGVRSRGPVEVEPGAPSPDEVMGLPSTKVMYPAEEPAFAELREQLENHWAPALCRSVGLARNDLPALWDIDLLPTDADLTRFALCEINASSIIPFPPEAPKALAHHVASQLTR